MSDRMHVIFNSVPEHQVKATKMICEISSIYHDNLADRSNPTRGGKGYMRSYITNIIQDIYKAENSGYLKNKPNEIKEIEQMVDNLKNLNVKVLLAHNQWSDAYVELSAKLGNMSEFISDYEDANNDRAECTCGLRPRLEEDTTNDLNELFPNVSKPRSLAHYEHTCLEHHEHSCIKDSLIPEIPEI